MTLLGFPCGFTVVEPSFLFPFLEAPFPLGFDSPFPLGFLLFPKMLAVNGSEKANKSCLPKPK